MKAYVMAAGVGTRLEPLTLAVPKPMVPVCNVPIMEYNISLLKKHGLSDITANLHYFPEHIENYFKDGSAHGVRMAYSFEEELMGTAGGVRKMAGVSMLKEGERAVVMSADVLTDIDLSSLIKFHEERGSRATIALIEVEDTSEFGVVVTDDSGRITAFQEKPRNEEALSRMVNTGVYVLEKEVVDLIPPETFYDFGKELFPLLVSKGVPFFGYKSDCYWKDIGNISNYRLANFDVASGIVPAVTEKRGKIIRPGLFAGRSCRVDATAVISGTAVLGDNCTVESFARISDSIIWNDVHIEKDAVISSAVIGSRCLLKQGCSVGKGVVMGCGNTVGRGVIIPDNSVLPPAR